MLRHESCPFRDPFQQRHVMRDVIQKVIAAEAEAKQKVLSAQAEVQRLVNEARKLAQEKKETARQTAQLESDKIMASAISSAEAGKQKQLAQAAADIAMQVRLDADTARQAVAAVVRCVCGSPNEHKGFL
jgi:vacuolar-type H+-ATPase subunit H